MAEYLAFDSGQWEDSKKVAFKIGQKYEFCLLESTKNMNIHPWALLRPVAWQEDTGELCEEECNDCCYQHDGHEDEEGRGEWPSDRVTEWPSDQVTKWPSDRKLRRRLTGWYILL